jgi:hypothetical protein
MRVGIELPGAAPEMELLPFPCSGELEQVALLARALRDPNLATEGSKQ